jgi:hypothetical protein
MTHTHLKTPGPAAEPQEPVIDVESSEIGEHLRPHPLKIRPEGNAFTDRPISRPRECMGRFRALPDELLAHLLEYLQASSLCALGSTCKVLYAFTRVDDLWRSLFIDR